MAAVTSVDQANEETSNSSRRDTGCCACTKDDFLPEESFKNWGNYFKALSNTGPRLKNRFLTRSGDDIEIHFMRDRSQAEMKKTLTWWDILWFGVGTVMGAGIFVLTGQATKLYAGPAVVLSYLISGIAALLSVVCYTEFSIELPVAGGSFAYLRVELGDFMAYIAAGNIIFEYVISCASVARSWTSYFATLCNHNPDEFRFHVRSLPEDFNRLDPIAVAVSIATVMIATISMKASSRINSFASIVHILVTVFIIVAGATKAKTENVTMNFAPFGLEGILKASSILYFAYVGFDGVATFAEEIKNPRRDIPIGLIGSMGIIITCYCLMSTILCLMQPYSEVDPDAPFTLAFQFAGMPWAKYIVALGALKGMTTVLLGSLIAQSRYFTHISRTHMVPPFLAIINKKTGTPMNSTIVMGVLNSTVALFTSLNVLSNLISISTLFLFSAVSVALIVRRYYLTGETTRSDRNKLICFLLLILTGSIASSAYWAVGGRGYIGYIVSGGVWFLATLGLQLMVKQARRPRVWGIPFMPWLPSASVAINLFIMGSIDGPSFVRFLVWTGLLLVYYVFIGLHASYDAAKELQTNQASVASGAAETMSNIEEGNATSINTANASS